MDLSLYVIVVILSSAFCLMNEQRVFFFLCVFRLLNTLLVQTFFDPDEYFQTLEPSYCYVFGNHHHNNTDGKEEEWEECPGLTWEWKRRPPTFVSSNEGNEVGEINEWVKAFVERSLWGPARAHLSIVPTWLFYHLLRILVLPSSLTVNSTTLTTITTSTWWVARGPMLLNAIIIAAPTDYAVWYSAQWLGPLSSSSSSRIHALSKWCLFASLISWFGAFTLVRTFANSQETALIMMSVALVSPELIGGGQQQQQYHSPPHDHHHTLSASFGRRTSVAFLLGGLAVSIRFTALAIYIPMGLLLALHRLDADDVSLLSRIYFVLLYPCAICGALGIGLGMVVDRYFYGFWTLPILGNFHFNVVLDYADLYGSHDWHWYVTVALPVVTGLLLPFAIWDLKNTIFQLFVPKRKQEAVKDSAAATGEHRSRCYNNNNLWVLVLSYLIVLSFNAHKEFRYVFPILPLVCLIVGPYLATFCTGIDHHHRMDDDNDDGDRSHRQGHYSRCKMLLYCGILVIPNLIALLYLGLFHQRGPIAVNQWLVQDTVNRLVQSMPVATIPTTRSVAGATETVDTQRVNTTTVQIHYFTGECHSTPLHSHLHVPPPLRFFTRTLDCSPSCRANPNVECETDQFQRNPVEFLAMLDELHNNNNNDESVVAKERLEDVEEECTLGDQTCRTVQQQQEEQQQDKVPLVPHMTSSMVDYVVTMSSYVTLFESRGLQEVIRFPQNINGANILGVKLGNDFLRPNIYRHLVIIPNWLEVSLDEMVVFINKREN